MLFGKFLELKGPDVFENGEWKPVSSKVHCDHFWFWLQELGIDAHRSAIVKAVAEKVSACGET